MELVKKWPEPTENNCYITLSLSGGQLYIAPGLVELLSVKVDDKVQLWQFKNDQNIEWYILKGKTDGYVLKNTSNVHEVSYRFYSIELMKKLVEVWHIEDVMGSKRFSVEKEPVEFDGHLIYKIITS